MAVGNLSAILGARRQELDTLLAAGAWDQVPALVDTWADDEALLPSVQQAWQQIQASVVENTPPGEEPDFRLIDLPPEWEERLHQGIIDPRLLLCTDLFVSELSLTLCETLGETPYLQNAAFIMLPEGVERGREYPGWSSDIEESCPLTETHQALVSSLAAASMPNLRSLCVYSIRSTVDLTPLLSAAWITRLTYLELEYHGSIAPLLEGLDAIGDSLSLQEFSPGPLHGVPASTLQTLKDREWVPEGFQNAIREELDRPRGLDALLSRTPPPAVSAGRYRLKGAVYVQRGALSDIAYGLEAGSSDCSRAFAEVVSGEAEVERLPFQERFTAPDGVLVLHSDGRFESLDTAAPGNGVPWFDSQGCEISPGNGAGDLRGCWSATGQGAARLHSSAETDTRYNDADTLIYDSIWRVAGDTDLRRQVCVLTDGWYVTLIGLRYEAVPE